MKFLVRGGTGFVGQALVKRLQELDHEITVLTRNPARAQRVLGPGVHCVDTEADTAGLVRELTGVDIVVNLAGEPIAQRWTPAVRARIQSSRVDGTRRIVEAMAEAQPRPAVLVSASAVGFYGDGGDEEIREDRDSGHDYLAGICRRWEEEAQRAEALEIRVVRLRLGVVLGRGGGMMGKISTAIRLGVGPTLGRPADYLPWVHLDDVVEAILWAASRAQMSGAYNVVGPEPARWVEFGDALRGTGKVSLAVSVPTALTSLALGAASASLLVSQRVIAARLIEQGFHFKHPDLASALRATLAPV